VEKENNSHCAVPQHALISTGISGNFYTLPCLFSITELSVSCHTEHTTP